MTAMNYQTTFKRYELKYLLTPAQKALILQVMQPHMRWTGTAAPPFGTFILTQRISD